MSLRDKVTVKQGHTGTVQAIRAKQILLMPLGWLAAIACISSVVIANAAPPATPSVSFEVQTRGPIHEAFAEVVLNDPAPGLVVPKQPPAAVIEQIPDIKPEGATAVWIPGYWSWDDDRQDFVWLSGVWRVAPPASRWIPGYWSKTRAGYQWTSGFWIPFNTARVQHLPLPPESKETGPAGQAPSLDHFYSPGYWVWRSGQYTWQSGFWSKVQGGWTWIPPRYVWTPAGCVFLAGHWDYPLAQRGLLFAPVYFASQGPAVGAPGVSTVAPLKLTPQIVINVGLIPNNLFVRPDYSHYYFGDYYGEKYTKLGFLTWFAWQDSGQGYDPIYMYDRWHWGRNNPQWDAQMRDGYRQRFANESARPPHTFAEMKDELAADPQLMPLAVMLTQVAPLKISPLKLIPLTPEALTRSQRMAQHLSLLSSERARLHTATTELPKSTGDSPFLAWNLPQLPDSLSGAAAVERGAEPVVKYLPGVNNPDVLPGVSGRSALPGMSPGVIPNQLPGAGPGTLQGLGIPPRN